MSTKVSNPISEIFKYLAISILFMFIGFAIGMKFVPEYIAGLANIIVIILVIVMLVLSLISRKGKLPGSFSMNFVYLFTFIDGIAFYPILNMYIQDLGPTIVINILVSTIALFGILAFISSKKPAGHYLNLGLTLLISLFILFILTIINIFIGSQTISILLSIVGVIIFSGYVLFDISLIKHKENLGQLKEKNQLSIHVLNLYLDFINIFLDLLNIADNFR
ncbi:Bax inhibitor-1/YccA family protein [Romboutsia maritimum]|nr:Bax inhibitor-1 family protein [Romboutsia maritimum]